MNSSDLARTSYQVKGVGHTGITVSDIDRSCRFYRDVLGLTVSKVIRVSGPSVGRITGVPDAVLDVAFVRCPGHVIELLSFAEPLVRHASKLRTCDPGFLHLCFKVSAIDAVIAAILAAGFETLSPIETMQHGPAAGMRVVYARDPDGVVLEFAEEPPGISFESLFFPQVVV
jgi:glyoxylase I family protein